MPANDDVESSRSRIQVKLLNVMQDVHQKPGQLRRLRGWQLGCQEPLLMSP